tara:strand:+ start:3748 stop:4308 length:561 start_codon:yes stop_codon:yes gene_type:complete
MAIVELTAEPTKLRAGDSVQWRVTYSDYLPSDGWALSYKLIDQNITHAIASSTDGDAYVVALTSTDTGVYAKGTYNFVGFVTNGSDRITVHAAQIEVSPNLASQTAGFDTRSNAKITLDLLDEALVTLGTKAWTQTYSIDNKSVTFRNFQEFTDFRRDVSKEVQKEINEDLKAQGRKPRNKISVVI